jgi:3-oxoacyl-[acyl-carrier protein] reductase
MSLNGKTALVTGGAQGIGLAIATRLAKEGANVAIFDINEEKARESADGLIRENMSAMSGYADVSNLDSIRNMIELVVAHFGVLDIVVNNAGILSSTPVQQITEDEWDRIMAVNLKGTFFVSQLAFPYLKDRPQPRIINLASIAGRMGGYESSLAYAASKGGVISMTYGLSRQYAPYGITVNSICPGPTETPMILQWSDEQLAGLLAKIPIGKICKPDHIAEVVTFLAGDAAEVITGLALDINGGLYVG